MPVTVLKRFPRWFINLNAERFILAELPLILYCCSLLPIPYFIWVSLNTGCIVWNFHEWLSKLRNYVRTTKASLSFLSLTFHTFPVYHCFAKEVIFGKTDVWSGNLNLLMATIATAKLGGLKKHTGFGDGHWSSLRLDSTRQAISTFKMPLMDQRRNSTLGWKM